MGARVRVASWHVKIGSVAYLRSYHYLLPGHVGHHGQHSRHRTLNISLPNIFYPMGRFFRAVLCGFKQSKESSCFCQENFSCVPTQEKIVRIITHCAFWA